LREAGCEWDCEEDDEDDAINLGSAIDAAIEGYCLCGPWHGRARPADLAFVRWLRELGAPWSSNALCRLIESEGVATSTLEWALANDCPMCARAGLSAAEAGRVDILRWLDGLDALPRSKKLTQAAARGGHLEALCWLRSHGCRWGPGAITEAAGRDHLHVVEWGVANGCPWCPTVVADAALIARDSGTGEVTGAPRVIAWLRRHGHDQVDWSEAQWEPHRTRLQFNYRMREHMKDAEWARRQRQSQHSDSNLESSDGEGGGDSADDDVSSVDSVDATTPKPGDDYEQFGPNGTEV
jgi:hypothetical protein